MIQENNVNKPTWKDFVKKNGPESGRFLQSYEWGDFQEATGSQVKRFVIEESDELKAVFQVIEKKVSFFGMYQYCPRGPIVVSGFQIDKNEIKNCFSDSFVFRFEQTSQRILKSASKISEIQPAHTLITNLSVSEETLLKHMHEKTRYNIRLAQKKGVRVEIGSGSFDEVWKLFEQTSNRGEFRLHSKEYYKKMLDELSSKECKAFLAKAFHDNDLLAANIMIDFDDTRTYLHGASSNTKRNLMAPYLLHWELMKDAKRKSLQFYDWWGVAPIGAGASHPWNGISRFKRGFGGKEIEYLGTYDLVLNQYKYSLYRFIKLIR